MADHSDQHQHHHHHHHHHHHRPHRLHVPPRGTSSPVFTSPPSTSRPYPLYTPSQSPVPTPTSTKRRLSSFSNSRANSKSSISFTFLLLFSLRSLYSLLPFLRSSPSFSLFPFSFLVSFLSFLLALCFSFFSASFSSSSKDPFHQQRQIQPIFSLALITNSQQRLLVAKSVLLALVFLLRFQALRYCGAAAMILAEIIGNVTARFTVESHARRIRSIKLHGFLALMSGMLMLSMSWDRIECFPLSSSFIDKWGFSLFPKENCVRVWPLLLPFLCGFLGCYERASTNWGTLRQLGHKRVRLITLFFTTMVLFVPAVISIVVFEAEEDITTLGSLAWPLANTVIFGVLLSENSGEDNLVTSIDFRREFGITFVCTLVLELIYFPELSLCGLLLCGLLLYVAVRVLDPFSSDYIDSGMESPGFGNLVMKPIRHMLSERKSRKIALFLLINTGYMVVEFVAGFMSNSLGLISDACHMLFDCAALAIGLYASYISRLPANSQYNYGRGRFEIVSGYANAVFLVLVGALIVLESFERILDPQEISTNSLLVVSVGGLVVNLVGLVFFHEEHHHAHGSSGSCSHSHSHSHHRHHSYGDGKYDHEGQVKHHDHDSVSYICVDKKYSSNHAHQDHNHCSHQDNSGCSKDHSSQCSHNDHAHHDHTCHDHAHRDTGHHLCHPSDHIHSDETHDRYEHVHHHDHHHSSTPLGDLSSEQSKITAKTEEMREHRSHTHHHIDHNMEGIFLHVLADTMGSVGVVISTLLIKYKGWLIADPACSIFISVLIISSVIPLLRNSAELLLQRVPRAHEEELREALKDIVKVKGVCGIRRFHAWSFTNTDVIGTLHLHVSTEADKASTKAHVSHILHDAGIKDLTLQIECIGL